MITFSPYDPKTRKLYPHIQRAFKGALFLDAAMVNRGVLEWEGTVYTIVNHSKLDAAFKVYDRVAVSLSFQEHLDGNYVVIG